MDNEKELIKVFVGYQDFDTEGYRDVAYGNEFVGNAVKRFDVFNSEGVTKIVLSLSEFESLSSPYETRYYESMNIDTNLILKIEYKMNEYVFKLSGLKQLRHRFMPLIGGFVVCFETLSDDYVEKLKKSLDYEIITKFLPKEKTQ